MTTHRYSELSGTLRDICDAGLLREGVEIPLRADGQIDRRHIRRNDVVSIVELAKSRSAVDPNTGCWVWRGPIGKTRYPRISWKGKYQRVSRLLLGLGLGLGESRIVARHRCDNPKCVNPDHLEAGTCRENTMDSIVRGRWGRPTARLSENSVAEIKRRLAAGECRAAIAREFGVYTTTVRNIAIGRSWKGTR